MVFFVPGGNTLLHILLQLQPVASRSGSQATFNAPLGDGFLISPLDIIKTKKQNLYGVQPFEASFELCRTFEHAKNQRIRFQEAQGSTRQSTLSGCCLYWTEIRYLGFE